MSSSKSKPFKPMTVPKPQVVTGKSNNQTTSEETSLSSTTTPSPSSILDELENEKENNERNKAHGHATTGSSENFCVHDPKDDVAENNNNEESNDQKSTDGDDAARRVIWDGPPVEVPLDMLFTPKVHYTSSQFLIVV